MVINPEPGGISHRRCFFVCLTIVKWSLFRCKSSNKQLDWITKPNLKFINRRAAPGSAWFHKLLCCLCFLPFRKGVSILPLYVNCSSPWRRSEVADHQAAFLWLITTDELALSALILPAWQSESSTGIYIFKTHYFSHAFWQYSIFSNYDASLFLNDR